MPEKLKNISRMNLRIRRGDVVFGDVLYAPGGICGPRVQQDYQLVVIHRGRLDLRLDGEQIAVPAGHAILLSPHHREYFQFDEKNETHHSWCSIRAAALSLRLRKNLRRQRGPMPFGSELKTLLETGQKSPLADQDELQDGFYFGLGLALLCGFAAQDGGPLFVHEALLRMEKTIQGEYRRALSLTTIARTAGISPQHLLRLCRQQGRPTPMKMLYAQRLEAAAHLLRHTGLSVGEVAERCGFVQTFHFSRRFHQAYGASPLAWRKALWRRSILSR
jgi:AraC-like DNA-binding protein